MAYEEWLGPAAFLAPFLWQWHSSLSSEVRLCLRYSGVLALALFFQQWSPGFFSQMLVMTLILIIVLSFLEAAHIELHPGEDFALSIAYPTGLIYPLPMVVAISYCTLRLLLSARRILSANPSATVLGLAAMLSALGDCGAFLASAWCVCYVLGALSLFFGALCLHCSEAKAHSE